PGHTRTKRELRLHVGQGAVTVEGSLGAAESIMDLLATAERGERDTNERNDEHAHGGSLVEEMKRVGHASPHHYRPMGYSPVGSRVRRLEFGCPAGGILQIRPERTTL